MSTVYCWEKVSCFSFKIRISILIQIHFCPNFKRTRAICDIWNKALSFSLQCNVNVIIKVTKTKKLFIWLSLTKSWNIRVMGNSGILWAKKSVCFEIFYYFVKKQKKCDLFYLIKLPSSFRTKLTFINYCIQCAINLNKTFEPNLKSLTTMEKSQTLES